MITTSPFDFPLHRTKLINLDSYTFSFLWLEQHQYVLIRKYEEESILNHKFNLTYDDFCMEIYNNFQHLVEENLN